MTKTAVTVLAVALLTMLFVVPVMATPKDSSSARHEYPATDNYEEISYDDLTALCVAAGLSKNPYPAPLTSTGDFNPVTGVYHIYGASEYYVLTMTIGNEAYPSVACNTFDVTGNAYTGNGHIDYKTTHYFGDLGKLNHGFAGIATVDFYSDGMPNEYFTGSWGMQGFGRFTGQTLLLEQDSRTSDVGSGYCFVLGNKWYK